MSLRGTIGTVLLVGAAAIGIAQAAPPAKSPTPKAAPKTPPPTSDAGVPSASPPASDPAPAAMDGSARLVALLRNKSSTPTLVGESGELYEPSDELQWKRSGAGGVSTDVQALFRTKGNVVFAVGSRAPLFRRKSGLWSAFHLGNRGRAAVSTSGAPIISVGRHIYELSGGSWMRSASAKGAIRALYAARAKQIYLVTTKDQLYVGYKSWRMLTIKLPAGDKIRSIVGLPGKHTVAWTMQNRLYLLPAKGAKAKLLALPPTLRGLKIDAMGVVGGKLMLAGRIGAGPALRTLLAEVGSQKVIEKAPLWPLEAGDRFALVLQDHKQRLMIASKRGQIRVRTKEGLWKNGVLDIAPPPPPEKFSHRGPAHSK